MSYKQFSLQIVLPVILLLSASCVKYSFRGALPSYLKTLYIVDFENKTIYPNARETLLDLVTAGFVSDNSLTIISNGENADLILEGAITSIRKQPVSITTQEAVQEFQLTVTVRVECKNTHTNKPLWSGSLSKDIPIEGTAVGAEMDAAIDEAIQQISDDIVTKTIAAW